MSNDSRATAPEVAPPETDPRGEQRAQPRFAVPADAEILFPFPGPDSPECSASIRDVSYGGLSFVLTPALVGLEFGWTSAARVRFGASVVQGHMLMLRVPQNPQPGSICGAMFFASSPEDRRTLRCVMEELGRNPR